MAVVLTDAADPAHHYIAFAGDTAEAVPGEGLAHLGLGAGDVGPQGRVAAKGIDDDAGDLRDGDLVGGVEIADLHG